MISFDIYSGESLNRADWKVLAEKSIMVSPEFVSIWQSRNLRPAYFVLRENKSILAGMAGVISGGRFIPRFESMIDGLDGGVWAIDDDKELASELYDHVLRYFSRHRFFRASIHNPSTGIPPKDFKMSERRTHVLNLSDNETRRDPKIDEHIRTGQKRGARVVVFDDPARLGAFHDLVMQTSRRHGVGPRYDPVMFERLYELSRVDKRIIWIGVLYENKLISSRISLISESRIINWQSFSDKEYAHLMANYLMMDYIISRARESGIDKIDLGGSPDGAEGLIDFKKRWGGRDVIYKSYTYYSAPGALYYRWKNR